MHIFCKQFSLTRSISTWHFHKSMHSYAPLPLLCAIRYTLLALQNPEKCEFQRIAAFWFAPNPCASSPAAPEQIHSLSLFSHERNIQTHPPCRCFARTSPETEILLRNCRIQEIGPLAVLASNVWSMAHNATFLFRLLQSPPPNPFISAIWKLHAVNQKEHALSNYSL